MLRQIAFPLLIVLSTALFVTTGRAQAPVIAFHPTNRLVTIGNTAVFSITATGAPPLFYQWLKDGEAVPQGTNRVLSLTNVTAAHVGSYAAVVTNFFGAATSHWASLTVTSAPPNITVHPVGRLLCVGGTNSTLVVQASGSPPLEYQWSQNGVQIPGLNTNRLSVPGNVANLGDYFVVVSNPFGSRTSAVARLEAGPRIWQQPTNVAVNVDSTARFTIAADACGKVFYQWRRDGVDIPLGTNQSYTIPSVHWQDAGYYSAVVSDNQRSVTGAVALLTVLGQPFAPQITQEPEDVLETTQASALFFVGYTAAPTPRFQWQFNGENLPGASGPILEVAARPVNQGGYRVVLSNEFGMATSRVATLTLRPLLPVIQQQPHGAIVCSYTTNPPVLRIFTYQYGLVSNSFQWRKNGSDLPGKTNSVLPLSLQPSSFGDYTVVVANYFGAVTSMVATVSEGPVIAQQPQELIVAEAGGIAYLGADVRSCSFFLSQWQRNGVNVPGATSTALTIHPLSLADSGDYRLIIRHGSGSLTSIVSRLEVSQRPPEIDSTSPPDRAVQAGEWTYFYSTNYNLGAPLGTFQWMFNGLPIPGANAYQLVFMVTSPQQQGRYSLVISNEAGSVTSRVARLTVLFSPPYFESEPQDTKALAGSRAYFYAAAVGAPPPSYQWLFNGQPIRHETNHYLSIFAHGSNELGGYSVVASNLLGSVTSRVATITLQYAPPAFLTEPADRTARAGEYVTFFGGASGAPPPTHQWFMNGNALPGETNSHLSFLAGFTNQSGGYWVVARNDYGAVTSRVARLDIAVYPPVFGIHPAPQSLVEGESATLSFGVMANTPVFAQWQRDGNDLPWATNILLSLRSATTNDTGDYRVIIWNDAGRATSAVARVEVRVAGPLDHWTWKHPLPQGNDLASVAYGNGRHVAVGWSGGVVISTNGVDWFDGHRDAQTNYRNVITFGNGVFVTHDNGRLQTSTNGVDWVDQEIGSEFNIYSIAYGAGRFVAGDPASRHLAISTNGINWDIHATVPVGGVGKIVYAGGLFVMPATSFNSPRHPRVSTSMDGITWTTHEIYQGDFLSGVAYGNGKFIGTPAYSQGHLVTATNGSDWIVEMLLEPRSLYARTIAWGNGVWVVGGYRAAMDVLSGLEYSTDAIHWTPVLGLGTNSVSEVLFDGTRFVAVGPNGFLAASTNGADWAVTNPGSDLNLRGITWANGLFVTVGNGGLIYTSADGRAWTRRDSGTFGNLRSVTWFHDRFIVVGGDDALPNHAIILSSTDGVLWQSHSGSGSLYGVAHNGERLVAVGNDGVIATSLDGVVWANLPFVATPGVGTPTLRDLNAVIWTGEQFMAVGKNGTIITSTNGLDWNSTGPNNGKNLKGIAHGNGVFVTVGNDGRFFTSEDGTSWSRRDLVSARDFEDITFSGGRFMAVGVNGQMHTSEDGTNWVRRVTVCGHSLRGVIFVEGSYYVAGNNETILQSGQADAALRITRLSPSGDVQVEILGEAGRTYRLQGSPDLAQWTDLHYFTAGAGTVRYTDNSPGASLRRFYRVISP